MVRSVVAIVCVAAAGLPAAGESEPAISRSADHILRCQLPDGGIAMTPDPQVWLVPYFADLAALGLLRAYQETNDSRYRRAVLRYIDWHAAHLNPDGTIYDFRGSRDQPEPTGDYDSSDAYPALFLSLCWETFQVTGDRAWLRRLWPALQRCVAGIQLTWQPDGLTFAKPTYRVKYLMDNLEVRVGLRAAVRIARTLGDRERQRQWEDLLEQNRRGLAQLWLAAEGRFAMAMFEDGKQHTEFARWYPDGMANAFALAYILSPEDPTARALGEKLERAFPADADYWRFMALWKMGQHEAAARVREKLAGALRYSVDHGLYLRALAPARERFFYQEDLLRLPDLAVLPPRPRRAP